MSRILSLAIAASLMGAPLMARADDAPKAATGTSGTAKKKSTHHHKKTTKKTTGSTGSSGSK